MKLSTFRRKAEKHGLTVCADRHEYQVTVRNGEFCLWLLFDDGTCMDDEYVVSDARLVKKEGRAAARRGAFLPIPETTFQSVDAALAFVARQNGGTIPLKKIRAKKKKTAPPDPVLHSKRRADYGKWASQFNRESPEYKKHWKKHEGKNLCPIKRM